MPDHPISREELEAAESAALRGDVPAVARLLRAHKDHPQVVAHFGWAGIKSNNDPEENARLVIIHKHYFNTWSEYQKFRKDAGRKGSPVEIFERAADAIAAGDVAMLQQLLQKYPGLVKERSVRNHHSTLLNYVGANGFEAYRQKTPKNAAEVARILLDAGSEIDAKGDMYRGTTTLGLVATSVHPVITGVQEELMDVLIRHGADPNIAVASDYTDGLLILACLHNGRDEPIEYLAKHGAVLDLEAAGGVGDLVKVKSYFNADGSLKDETNALKRDAAFIWAGACGRMSVVGFMLEIGIDIATTWDGMSALHGAVYGGHLDMVKFLISKNAPLEIKNAYNGTVLGQAIWCGYNHPKKNTLAIIDTLLAAGAKIEPGWKQCIEELRGRA